MNNDIKDKQNIAQNTKAKNSQIESSMDNQSEFDIVLYGATSFVGELTAHYLNEFLAKNDSEQAPVKWAIAGRNRDKLEKVKKDMGNESLPIIIADSKDKDSLDHMTKNTKVIISTVGPYLKYGEPLVKSCTDNGIDYVDLTGEVTFIKDMLDKYQEAAKESGARIVNSCGFDSIPSDLGVFYLQQCAKDAFDTHCSTVHMGVKAAKGELSGGTYASMATIFEQSANEKKIRKQLTNPYLLNDDSDAPKVRQQNIIIPTFDEEHDRWQAPFIMAIINTRIVHRSNQLLDYSYGRDFKYDEAMWLPASLKGRLMSYAITAGVTGFAAGMMFKPSRTLITDYMLPKTGDGPSKEVRENGYFDIRFIGYTAESKQESANQIKTKVTGDRDPGYGSTCRMLVQSALCLLQDINKEDLKGGFWTPASAMGYSLIERLEAHAGIHFEQLD